MATGITYPIHDGKPVSFERFMWTCARMMMPLVIMRDEDLDKLPPDEFAPFIGHYDKSIERLRAEVSTIEAMSESTWQEAARAKYAQGIESVKETNRRAREICARYQDMLDKVQAWNPPTKDHEGVKKFALEQLTDSIRHDGYTLEPPKPPIFATWKSDRLASLRAAIEREEKCKAEEIQRTAWRNAWLKTLRESVPYPTA